jgi:hypothetical protein
MDNVKKDAGQARERPRPPVAPSAREAAEGGSISRSAGVAPRVDAATRELQPRGRTPGMLANPWVRQYTNVDSPQAESKPAETEAPSTPRVDAGAAPEPRGKQT